MLRIGSALVLAMLAIAAPARAQDADELWNWCFGNATDDQTIKGCDAVIGTKRGATPAARARRSRNRIITRAA